MEQPLEPWPRGIVWCGVLLLCLIVWAGACLAYLAAGGPLP
jgi:hypothetical protein